MNRFALQIKTISFIKINYGWIYILNLIRVYSTTEKEEYLRLLSVRFHTVNENPWF